MQSKVIPQQITILCDTREQRPLKFHPTFKTERFCLKTGDYSCKHLEHIVALERKSLQDFIMCVGRERERFEREIQRLIAFPVCAIIVEGSWIEIELQKYRGETHPNSVFGSAVSWIVSRIPIIMAGDHQRAGKFVEKILLQVARNATRGKYENCEQFISSLGCEESDG